MLGRIFHSTVQLTKPCSSITWFPVRCRCFRYTERDLAADWSAVSKVKPVCLWCSHAVLCKAFFLLQNLASGFIPFYPIFGKCSFLQWTISRTALTQGSSLLEPRRTNVLCKSGRINRTSQTFVNLMMSSSTMEQPFSSSSPCRRKTLSWSYYNLGLLYIRSYF